MAHCSCTPILLTPVEIPLGCSLNKVLAFGQHASLAIALASTITALYSAIFFSPSYFFFSITALSLSLLVSYHIRRIFTPPILPSAILLAEHKEEIAAHDRHRHPQLDHHEADLALDTILFNHQPPTSADIPVKESTDDIPLDQQDADRLTSWIKDEEVHAAQRLAYLK